MLLCADSPRRKTDRKFWLSGNILSSTAHTTCVNWPSVPPLGQYTDKLDVSDGPRGAQVRVAAIVGHRVVGPRSSSAERLRRATLVPARMRRLPAVGLAS